MRIPFWIWIILGLTAISWIIPDGIPGEEFILPAIAVAGLLLRRLLMKNFYQQQYQQYQRHQSSGGQSSQGTSGGSSGGTGSSFYNRFKGWGGGFHQPPGAEPQKDPYTILGVTASASMDEIKKAYRTKLKKFHPDVIENLKLGPEYREMFEERTREIQKAYEKLGGK